MTTQNSLEEIRINVKLKLAALWTSFMFLYIYVDYFALYMPKKIEHILAGKVHVFDITQGFLLIALVSVSIPAMMIFLSVILPANITRRVNKSVAMLYIPYTLYNLSGETWAHMIYGAVVEVIILFLIIFLACKWPRIGTT